MKILHPSRLVVTVRHVLTFAYDALPSAGYAFECDANGVVDEAQLEAPGLANYRACLAGTNGTHATGVETYENRYREPAVGECVCGASVCLDSFTNTCDCGRDYNRSGNLLAARALWGDDTGERLEDILRIP